MRAGRFVFKINLFLFLSLSALYSHAQEICNNGIDDDGDGKIDLYDESCKPGVFNLIQNPSFESISGCPDNWSKLHYAINWMQAHPTAGSTDLYHKCGACNYSPVGFIQQAPLPAPHGDGFAGFYDTKQYDTYGEYKEYLATCLAAALKKDSIYRLRFSLGFLKAPNATTTYSRSPVSISFFGTASCSSVQYSNGFRRCPLSTPGGGWTELKKIEVAGNPGEWVTVEAEFTAPGNINGLVIGPSCAPNIHDGENYYLIDRILMYEKRVYHIPQIDRTGDICADTLVLRGNIAPAPTVFTCQWYKNGAALPGENSTQLKLTRAHYGEGVYSISYTIGRINYLSPEEIVTINDHKYYLADSVALCTNTVLLRPELYPVQANCSVSYTWQDGSVQQTFEATTPGWHWFETNKDGCKFRDSVFVFAYPPPGVNLGADTTLCSGQQVTLVAGASTLAFKWQDGSTNSSYTVTKAGDYSVSVSNKQCVSTDTIVVQYKRSPEVQFLQDSIICEGEEKVLKPYLYGDEFRWNTGSTSAEIKIKSQGVYNVAAKNECGVVNRSITITKSSCEFFLPNAFTPNADGLNDRFGLKEYSFIRQYSMSIYNRWGEIVYHSTNPASQWSGWIKGKAASQGVYVWMVIYTDWLGRKINRKGTLVLIRSSK